MSLLSPEDTPESGIPPRPDDRLPRPVELTPEDLERPTLATAARLIYNSAVRLFHDPIGMVIASTFLLIMLWGHHGGLQLLAQVWDGWGGPGSDPATRSNVIAGIAWDQEWIAFFAGCVLLVVVPCLLIKLVFRQRLRAYGLGLPPPGRRRFAVTSAVALFVLGLPVFFFAAQDDAMRATYPLFRGEFGSTGDFLAYTLGYLAFFVAIEFIFRGFLLFGIFQFRDVTPPAGAVASSGPLTAGYYAVLISMLSYTAWHLGKPELELWGTIAWGLGTGAIALMSRSILLIILVHWLLNAFMDYAIWQGWSL